ncbi:sterol desaturase family protein [Lutibacter maritimus]|uniref:Sterol desaturase/sphingolipid hydroxylase, fatty acid hydroxylase superfamily n=1 Tax=Lutibacter maritimus TaxID=593133 RepID=A0A1I6S182_9FLAO|nr:sterol desaturase family protein [Lutibacter maritimus]SFS70630.1 Sterol desaturase/sphingolipid hydroxylase, fatty acid hydroxylase superfamily [Lutibacter maritimus]
MEIPQIPNLIYYAIPFFIVTVIFESIVLYKKKPKNYNIKDTFASLTMGIGNVLVNLLSKLLVVFIITFLYENFRFTTIPFVWWSWLLILFADDFCYYWAHRMGHESRFFWASHIVHHSSQKYNLSTALRQTWTGGFFTFVFYLALPLLGFHPLMIFTQMSISLLYQYWIHTELIDKMPKWFEAVFNTPSHHRVHHGSNPLYLDRNHAGIFIIWDKLFGTFQPELKEEKVIYGLTSNIDTYNPVKIAFHEWMAVFKDACLAKTSLVNKLKYFIKPPGWKHDGTGLLSDDLRKEWLSSKSIKNK